MTQFYTHAVREPDAYGSGEWGAPRGGRKHTGVDFAVKVVTPISGEITKLGYAYKDDLSFRYVRITDDEGYHVDLFYVEPEVKEGDEVKAGDIVGSPQTLQKRYPDGITDHIHVRVLTPHGHKIPWTEYEELLK